MVSELLVVNAAACAGWTGEKLSTRAATTSVENRENPRVAGRFRHVRAGLEGLPRPEFLGDFFDGPRLIKT